MVTKDSSSRCGFIQTDKGEISFFSKGHTFTFFKKTEDLFEREFIENSIDGFLVGKTSTGHKIAIYTNNGIKIVGGQRIVNTVAYVISKGNLPLTDECEDEGEYKYDGIEFVGGTLNHLFARRAFAIKRDDDKKRIITPIDNYKKYDFNIDGITFSMSIGNSFNERHSDDGIEIRDTDVNLSIKFNKKQSLVKLLKVVTVIKDMLSFMCFRGNVGFESVNLLKYDENWQRTFTVANLFLRQDEEIETKRIDECITFKDLDDYVKKLITMFYENKDNKPSYMLGFIPKTSKKVGIISNTDIKEICSALECELKFINDLSDTEDANLKGLINDVKGVIKKYKKDNPKALSDKTYSMIFGGISHWSLTASEKIGLLYKRYEEEMTCLNSTGMVVAEKEINEFVKYRNEITHGSYRVLNMEVATTAYILSGLVYCCILSRIGLNRQKILELCQHRKIIT